jgi:protein TonB
VHGFGSQCHAHAVSPDPRPRAFARPARRPAASVRLSPAHPATAVGAGGFAALSHGPQDPDRDETLLKNTLLTEKAPVKAPPATPPAAHPGPAPGKAATRRQLDAVQRKLAQHQYYPPEAIARGIEGEGSLLLTLAEDGSISEVSIAVSSGHPILDKAAVRAAYAMARVNWAHSRELILPFVFRLE